MRFFIASLLHLFITNATAQSLFYHTYGTTEAEERAFDMVVLSDGSVITAGDRYESSTFQRTGYLLKVDADGLEQWNRQLQSNEDLYGTTICQLPNGNVFVAGYDLDVPSRNFGIVVAEYNASNGLPVYQSTHEFAQDAQARDVIPTPDNGAIVLASLQNGSVKTNFLVRFDAAGDTLWTKVVDPFAGNEEPREMALLSDGIIMTGSVHIGTTDKVFILKTDLSGNLLWQQEYASSGLEFGEGIVEVPSGGFYIAGTTNAIGNGGLDLLAMKVDGSGTLLWAQGFGGSGNELGYDVDLMPDGGAIFTGSAYKADTSNFRDLVLIRTNADGDTLWTRFFGNAGAETGYEVKVDGDQIVACGKADVINSEDIVILRTDFNGNSTLGINAPEDQMALSIYPNPFAQQLTLQLNSPSYQVITFRLFDMAGRSISQATLSQTTTFDLGTLSEGLYIASCSNSSGTVSTTRLMKGR